MNWLKQSTAATVKLGPFVDSTDGVTAETALTVQKADVRLSKNGGDMAAASADQGAANAGAPHDELGYYDVSLDATDTGTLGRLRVMVTKAGALPVWMDWMVLPGPVYDALVANSDKLEVDVEQWKGATAPAMTGDAFERLGAPVGASIAADIATRSTLTAQQVWEYATRSLSTFGTLVADIWNAATAALTAAGSIGKLLVDNINATIGSRSTYDGSDTSGTTTLLGRLTATRAGYLDKLNISGNVASQSEVLAIQNNTRIRVVAPGTLERPDAGSVAYELNLYIYDEAGNMEAPDSTPTVAARNQGGTSRSANLSAVSNPATGHYKATYTLASGDAIEQLIFEWTVVEGSQTRIHGVSSQVVDTTAVDFTSADRAKLDTLHDTRLTADRAGKLDNLDVQVSTRLATAGYTAPDNTGIATAASNASLAKTAADSAASAASLAAGNASDAATAAGAVSTKLAGLTEDVGGDRFRAHALSEAPAGAGSDPEVIAEAVDTQLSTTHGAGSWESDGGVGGGSSAEDIDALLSERHGAGSWETPKAVVTRSTLSRYLTDLVEWVQVPTETDGFGNPIVDPVTSTIQGRIKHATKVVTTIAGAEVVATGHVLMFEQPTAGFDILRWNETDHLVIAVDEERAFSARAYRAYFQ